MLTTSTHDTRRGEDVRARVAAGRAELGDLLSEFPVALLERQGA